MQTPPQDPRPDVEPVVEGPSLSLLVTSIGTRADTAAELAENRLDGTGEEYVDEALLERVYAEAVLDTCAFLSDGVASEGMKLVLRSGRSEGDDLPDDDPELGYPPVPGSDDGGNE